VPAKSTKYIIFYWQKVLCCGILFHMKREIASKLTIWKNSTPRKPLILRGARQVGKTYSLKEFGQREFKNYHYLNFEEDERISRIFEGDLRPQRIIEELRFYLNHNIDPAQDLVIFDEIQRCGRALTSLKYFCEEMPTLAVCAAGSLLGTVLNVDSFPVGKVIFLDMYPMNFAEFLEGTGEETLSLLLNSHDIHEAYPVLAHERLWELWKHYLVVGGLPSVVFAYASDRSNLFETGMRVRKIQRDLFSAYHADIAKHSGKANALHVERLWSNIPVQLARAIDGSAPKFRFKEAISGIRGYERLSGPIHWLKSAGLIIQLFTIEKAAVPLSAFASDNSFKLYMFDVGMLGAISDIHPATILQYGFGSYQGYVAENFVAQELLSAGVAGLYCWMGKTSEIEFLVSSSHGIIPVEVKSGKVVHSKSLAIYEERYHPDRSYILSARNSERKGKPCMVPLYAAGTLARYLKVDYA
jgi:predicted AAA+ superfamily ATPase